MRLAPTATLSAAGGVNVSYNRNDVAFSPANPALLGAALHGSLHASFNGFLGGVKAYSLTGALHHGASNTTFGGHVYFVGYGALPSTDASGNTAGEFRPTDFVAQLSAAKIYLERWHFGASLKLIGSSYQQYKSSAIAADIGLRYNDSARGFSAGLVAKNMGTQLKTFAGEAEDLPFDLQVGISKRLAKAPFGFSLTAQQVHQPNIAYNDASFNGDNGFGASTAFDKAFTHVVVAAHIYPAKNIEATIGYNHLRRHELSVPGGSNGLAGFSAGCLARFSKLQFSFARSTYQRGVSYNQLGITVQLSKLTGTGG